MEDHTYVLYNYYTLFESITEFCSFNFIYLVYSSLSYSLCRSSSDTVWLHFSKSIKFCRLTFFLKLKTTHIKNYSMEPPTSFFFSLCFLLCSRNPLKGTSSCPKASILTFHKKMVTLGYKEIFV